VQAGGAFFVVQFQPGDEGSARDVAKVLPRVEERLRRWGTFRAPVTVRIQPTHEALEEAAKRYDYAWLRAWARFDTVDLQSPRTWSLLGASQAQLLELLTHELTHCLMYQRAADAGNWTRKGIPLWFREGLASVSAGQGYRRPADEDIWRYLKANPDKDPVADAEDLYQTEADVVYGTAHRAVEFLVERYGPEAPGAVLDRMHEGSGFDAAFRSVVGLGQKAFAREYLRYVRWEGWRGGAVARRSPLVPVGPQGTGAAGDTRR